MVFAPDAVVYHSHPSSVWRYLSRKLRFGVWRTKVYARFPGKLGRDSYTPRAMPFQILLSGLLVLSLAVAILRPAALWATGFLAVAFLLSISRFFIRALARDKAVALVAPPLLFLRSLVQFLGVAVGGATSIGRRERGR